MRWDPRWRPERWTTRAPRRRLVAWDKVDGYGVELAEVALGSGRLAARGLAIGWHPVPYRLDYALATSTGWITTRLRVAAEGDGWLRTLDLRRSRAGAWSIAVSTGGDVDLEPPGGDTEALADALDCDLGLSPLTNSMPVLRHDLLTRPDSRSFVMAWVSVPALAVRRSSQAYASVVGGAGGVRRVEYRSLDGDFVSQLSFDHDGLVIDYPRLARRVP